MNAYIRSHPIPAFIVLAYAISWSTLLVDELVLIGDGGPLKTFLNYFAKFGPTLAGVIVTTMIAGKAGFAMLGRSLLHWRVHPGRWIIAFALPTALWVVALGGGGTLFGPAPQVGWSQATWWAPLTFFAMRFFLGGGLGEEIGWRGVMLPTLQQKHGALVSSLIIGLFWGLWHAPVQFLGDVEIVAGVINTILFTIYTTALSILFTWHYNATGGSILLACVLHAAMNGTNAYVETIVTNFDDIDAVIWYGFTALALAVALTVVRGAKHLSNRERATETPLFPHGD